MSRLEYFYTSPFYQRTGQDSVNEQRRRGASVADLRGRHEFQVLAANEDAKEGHTNRQRKLNSLVFLSFFVFEKKHSFVFFTTFGLQTILFLNIHGCVFYDMVF